MKTTRDIVNQVLFHKTAIIKNVVAAILMVAIFVFEGCFNFATMSWNWTTLMNPAYWVKVGTKVILFLAIKSIALLIFLDVARGTNTELVKQRNLNEKLMKLKGRDFPIYIENILNPAIKKEAWIKLVKDKLFKLEKHAKLEDRALYFSDKVESKNYNKYCIKRTELEKELTDDWIDKNKDVLQVKNYDVIDPEVFDQPINCTKENKYQLTSRTKNVIALSLLGGVIFLLISQAVWNAAEIKKIQDYDALAIWIAMFMDLVFLLWQGFTGIVKAFQTVNDQEVIPYVNRNRILNDYMYWKYPDKKDNLTLWIQQLEEGNKKEEKEA